MENDDTRLEEFTAGEEGQTAEFQAETPVEQLDEPDESAITEDPPIQEDPAATDAEATDTEPPPEYPDGEAVPPESEEETPPEPPKAKRKAPAKRAAKAKKDQPEEPEELPGEQEEPPEKPEQSEPVEVEAPEPAPGTSDELPVEKPPFPAATPPAKRPAAVRPKTFRELDLRELDRNLSDAQREEWNEIYASYRSKSILSGHIMGVEDNRFSVQDPESGQVERKRIASAVVIPYRVKVLIPETEMWMPGEERPVHVLRNMVGGKIDYVIMDIDRENECAIASRRVALAADRHYFRTARGGHQEGELLQCQVLAVGPKRCLVECGGCTMTLTQRDMSYVATSDLREKYHPGQELPCVLKEYAPAEDRLAISVKEVDPNPFDGSDTRHPVSARRQAVISGKYAGGVFCTLPDNTTCLCLYSAQHSDRDFHVGDTVILVIRQYDYHRKLIYGRILAKW